MLRSRQVVTYATSLRRTQFRVRTDVLAILIHRTLWLCGHVIDASEYLYFFWCWSLTCTLLTYNAYGIAWRTIVSSCGINAAA
jgi:hypothetical protein